MSTIRFGYTIAYVPDVRATLDFFTRAFQSTRASCRTTEGAANSRVVKRRLPSPRKRWARRISNTAICVTRWRTRHLAPKS